MRPLQSGEDGSGHHNCQITIWKSQSSDIMLSHRTSRVKARQRLKTKSFARTGMSPLFECRSRIALWRCLSNLRR
jgi:hypothetical protein